MKIETLLTLAVSGVAEGADDFAATYEIPHYSEQVGERSEKNYTTALRNVYKYGDAVLIYKQSKLIESPHCTTALHLAVQSGKHVFLYTGANYPDLLAWLDTLGESVDLVVVGPTKEELSASDRHSYHLFVKLLVSDQ